MPYRPILNERGVQVGYADGETAFDQHGKMRYHIGKDGALKRLGDGNVVATLIEAGSALSLIGEDDTLFS